MTVKLAFLYNSLRTEGRSELIIKVSVIIPVYNAESFLRPCLNSVISQNYKDSEIILIENGSEAGRFVKNMRKDLKISVLSQKRREGPQWQDNEVLMFVRGKQ